MLRFIILFCFFTAAFGMICNGTTNFNETFTLYVDNVEDPTLMMYKVGDEEDFWGSVVSTYDGYKSGLLLANSIAIKYENHYGCLRNVVITTDIRIRPPLIGVLYVDKCRGGIVPDKICGF